MAQDKESKDKKLVEELQRKLEWLTYEADEEEFDPQQVQAILALLNRLDPPDDVRIRPDGSFVTAADGGGAGQEDGLVSVRDPEAALERFKRRYGITDEDLARKTGKSRTASDGSAELSEELAPGFGGVRAADGNIAAGNVLPWHAADRNASYGQSAEESISQGRAVGSTSFERAAGGSENGGRPIDGYEKERKKGKTRRNGRQRSRFAVVGGRAAAAVVIAVGTLTFLGLGTSAVTRKPFFEVVQDGVNRLRITVTGDDGMEEVGEVVYKEDDRIYYDSWEDVKKEFPDIMIPTYIPEGMRLDELYRNDLVSFFMFQGKYYDADGRQTIISIRYFHEKYGLKSFINSENWNIVEYNEKGSWDIYQKDSNYQINLVRDRILYTVMGENQKEIIDIVEKIE